MTALLGLIPFKYWLYAGLLAVAGIFAIHEYQDIEEKGAAKEQAAVLAESAKTQAAVKAANDKLSADYSAAIVTVGENYAKAMQSADTAHAADVQRLQQRASAVGHSAGTSMDSAAAPVAAGNAGSASTTALGTVPAERALDLADALRGDDAALTQCYADRDSLTGK